MSASALLLGTTDGVAAELVPFSGAESLVHVYGDSGPNHLAFVLIDRIDTGCGDRSNFSSACVDDGTTVTCDTTQWQDAHFTGSVLFLDGHFPLAAPLASP